MYEIVVLGLDTERLPPQSYMKKFVGMMESQLLPSESYIRWMYKGWILDVTRTIDISFCRPGSQHLFKMIDCVSIRIIHIPIERAVYLYEASILGSSLFRPTKRKREL